MIFIMKNILVKGRNANIIPWLICELGREGAQNIFPDLLIINNYWQTFALWKYFLHLMKLKRRSKRQFILVMGLLSLTKSPDKQKMKLVEQYSNKIKRLLYFKLYYFQFLNNCWLQNGLMVVEDYQPVMMSLNQIECHKLIWSVTTTNFTQLLC